MGPKKVLSPEEAEELKKSLDSLTEQVRVLSDGQKKILDLTEEIKQLRLENTQKDNRINELEKRLDDLEQYSRMNDVIITGLKVKPRSYARAVAGSNNGGEPTEEEVSSTEHQVVTFFREKGINVNTENIEACHLLPKRRNIDVSTVILRFDNRKYKNALMKQGRLLRGTDVYVNEHLTRKNGEIAKKARLLKKQNKIQGTWVRNCKIFIKLNGSPEEAKVIVIRNLNELDRFV